MVEVQKIANQNNGPTFTTTTSKRLTSWDMDLFIKDILVVIQEERPDIIGETVDVYEEYGVSRLFR